MLFRSIPALAAGCVLLLTLTALRGADRGPSTPEERKQALEYVKDLQANPLGAQALEERRWLLTRVADIPDVAVHVCMILETLPKSGKKDSDVIFGAEVFSQLAFLLEHPDKKDDRVAEFQKGVEGALRVYELLLNSNPKDRQPYLDDLIQRRAAGTLANYVKARAAAQCTK